MSAKFCAFFLVLTLSGASLEAAPPPSRDFVSELRNRCDNAEAELSLLDEKISSQEAILEALQREQKNTQKLLQDALKTKTGSLEQRLVALESSLQQLVQDNAAFKKHLEKQNEVLMTLHERIAGYETALAQQGSNVSHLQNALSTLTEAFQEPTAPTATTQQLSDGSIYQVQPGDSLGKIAVKLGISIKALKEANNLTSDKIIVGQKLVVPPKGP